MSSDVVVEVEAVGKDYELGELASLGRTVDTVRKRLRGRKPERPFIRALDDVSFTVGRGESIALLGRNGSGKSTMVSMIAGATVPTRGRIRVHGTVMPLLSVGAGFNPDLTGRENVLLFGRILGLSRETIEASMHDIAAFAEIKPAHLLTPTKRYSSGMRARLSFATALRLPADLYILDEVLASADDEFKERAANHLDDLRRRGAALLFISHELPLLERICDRGIWLHEGRIHRTGTIAELGAEYAGHLQEAAAVKRAAREGLSPAKAPRRLRVSGRGA